MAKRTQLWVSRKDMTLGGVKVSKGQLITPSGGVNDRKIFADDSPWAFRYDGSGSYPCGTDGCTAEFDCEANLFRHRRVAHKADWDARERSRLAGLRDAAQAEERGETVGGRPIVDVKSGPGGPVPYVKLGG